MRVATSQSKRSDSSRGERFTGRQRPHGKRIRPATNYSKTRLQRVLLRVLCLSCFGRVLGEVASYRGMNHREKDFLLRMAHVQGFEIKLTGGEYCSSPVPCDRRSHSAWFPFLAS